MRDSANPEKQNETRAHPADAPTGRPFAFESTQHLASPLTRREAPIGRVDRYILLEELGAGGFGAVYRAHDDVADIQVAIKVLPPLVAHNPEELNKVRENFKLVATLRHPNIANVLHLHTVEVVDVVARSALGIAAGDHLIVMDYVPGQTITAYRNRYEDSRIPQQEAFHITARIAEALDYAHSQNIIHRDIKPANIIISPEGDVRVLDFGLAAHIRSSLSRISHDAGDTCGTPAYMAPEQWAGRRQGPGADQYGLAVLLYEMISGMVPFSSAFESNSRLVMFHAVKTETPEPLLGLSKKQNRAVLKALAKDTKDRFGSCAEFINALTGGNLPIANAGNNHRTHRTPAAESHLTGRLLVVLILLLMLAVVAHQGMREYQAYEKHRTEEQARQDAKQAQQVKIRKLLDLARTALEEKDHTAASEAVRQALEAEPDNPEAKQLQMEIKLTVGLTELVPASSEAETKWRQLEEVDRGQGFGEMLDRAKSLRDAAKGLFGAEKYGESLENYRQLLTECERLQKLDSERQAARRNREAALAAVKRAREAKAETDASELFAGATRLVESASKAFDGGDFVGSSQLWMTACAELAKAEAAAKGTLAARMAQEGYGKRLGALDAEVIQKYAEAEWEQLQLATEDAERLAREGKWSEAARRWDEAKALLTGAVAEAERNRIKTTLAPREPVEENALRAARGAEAIARAEAAKADGDWEGVLRAAGEALEKQPDSTRAKALSHEAKEALTPRLNIIAVIDDRETVGAQISLDGVPLEQRTPAKIRLERGKAYRIGVTLSPIGGTRYTPFETIFRAETGGEQELRAELKRTSLPPDLAAAENADQASLEGLADGSREAQEQQKQAAAELGLPIEVRTWQTDLRFRLIPLGTLSIDLPPVAGTAPEGSVRRATLSMPFYVSRNEVTQKQWVEVMGALPESTTESGQNTPVTGMTWDEADTFCRELATLEGVPEGTYRLLTEAEWEYSCRAGTDARFVVGDDGSALDRAAWIKGKANADSPQPVGQKQPNAWGLSDCHGNVREWCRDWFAPLLPGDTIDAVGPDQGTEKVVRGGSYLTPAETCASSARDMLSPASRAPDLGLRIMRGIPWFVVGAPTGNDE